MVQLSIQPVNFFAGRIRLNRQKEATILFQVTLGCGCPICAGGRFDAGRFRADVSFYRKGEMVTCYGAGFTGKASEFECIVAGLEKGYYFLEINVLDPETGMAGRYTAPVTVE